MAGTWRTIAQRKQDERSSRIPQQWLLKSTPQGGNVLGVPRECGLLTEHEIRLTEDYDATVLVTKLSAGQLKSEDVVRAFCKRAAIAQQLTNCLTEILFDDGLVRARELDAQFAKTGKPTGPLHGLPISLKDTFKIRGYDASTGIANLCFKPASKNSALADLLLDAGAVLYCKTNVPQTMSSLDSHNNVFGRTMNPRNRELTAGGSSGGEGALVALRGSILGVGTDIGGSIRVPTFCNYLVGVKPSHGRVPFAGQESGARTGGNRIGIEPTAGPIATTVRDCELFLKVVSECLPETYDADIVSQTWAQQTSLEDSKSTLRIGIVRTDGHVTPLPPIVRLLDDVARTLKSASRPIEVVELDITSILSALVKPTNGILSIDGANSWFDQLDATSEPLSPWLQGRLTRRKRKPTEEVVALNCTKLEMQTEFLKVWRESGGYWLTDTSKARQGNKRLDAIILPGAPHPIAPIDRWNDVNYTAALNFLDLPAGVVPVRLFTEKDLAGEVSAEKPLNGWDKINRELWTKVDRKVYLGSALSVQVFTPRLAERKLVEAMAAVEEALKPLREDAARSSKL